MSTDSEVSFADLALPDFLLTTLKSIGYESPSPIQAQCIPLLLEGKDLIGQAQTGTGKTAAFALPTLSRIDLNLRKPQALVICPTRELAIQVAEAFSEYAKQMKGFKVLPVYGGQPYPTQLRQIERGVHVVVGTPGRIMDHMRRGSLKWDDLKTLVLDEADEMLRMGFIDDVNWILEHTPESRQIALFSATMPAPIKKVAQKFLQDPQHIQIKSKAKTASTIQQLFITVSNNYKVEALTRVLESESSDATIIFVRTKSSCDELASKLTARGHSAEAIHGDMAQKQREQIVQQLKDGKIDIVIATDVAARGLDVERISHVINYDIPYDSESYVHRIGRTGRAGRLGKAILFITPRERHLLRMIERNNSTTIERMSLPSVEVINDERTRRFFDDVQQNIISGEHQSYVSIIEQIQAEHNQSGTEIASAIASLLFKGKPLLLDSLPDIPDFEKERGRSDRNERGRGERGERGRNDRGRGERGERGERSRSDRPRRSSSEKAPVNIHPEALKGMPDFALERYVIHVGRNHGVTPKHIVGAIANEAEIDSKYIGNIKLFDEVTTVDLPSGMPEETRALLKKTRVCGNPIDLQLAKDYVASEDASGDTKSRAPRRDGERKDSGRKDGRRKDNGHRDGPPRSGKGKGKPRSPKSGE